MNPPGNDAGGGTPPSSQSQLRIQGPPQPPSRVNNGPLFIREPLLPPHSAGGRRTPPLSSSQSQLRIQEPSQPPYRVNDGSHIIREPSLPQHSAGGRTMSSSFNNQLRHQRPRQHPIGINQESHPIKKPSSSQNQLKLQPPPLPPLRIIDKESHITKTQILTLGNDAGGGTPPSSQSQLRIQEPGQPPSRVNDGSLIIREPSLPLHSAGGRTMSPSFNNQLQHQRPRQHPLRINQESHTIKKPSSSQNQLKLQPPPLPPLRIIDKESHITKKPSLPRHDAGSAQQRPCREVSRQQKEPIVIIHEEEVKIIHCLPKDFPDLVQRLTGEESPKKETSGHGDVSPAMNVSSIEKTSPRKNDRQYGVAMTELESLEVEIPKTLPFVHDESIFLSSNMESPLGQSSLASQTSAALAAITVAQYCRLSPIPNTVPFMDEINLFGSSSVLPSSTGMYSPVTPTPAPNTMPSIHDFSTLWSENCLFGSSLSELPSSSMLLSSGISSPVRPNLASNTMPYIHDFSTLWSENSLFGSSLSGLPSSSMGSSSGISSPVRPTLASNTMPSIDDFSTVWSENSLLGSLSGRPPSSMVSSSGISSPAVTPNVASNTMPFMHDMGPLLSENSFFGSPPGLNPSSMVPPPEISSSTSPSFAPAAPYGFSEVPSTVPLMDNVSPFVSENILLGSSSGLQSCIMALPSPVTPSIAPSTVTSMHAVSPLSSANSLLGISSPASPSSATALPEWDPEAEPLMDDVDQLWSEYSLMGSPYRLQPWSMVSPPGISLTAAPNLVTVLPESVPQAEQFIHDMNPLWPENNFSESPSVLQPSRIVSPPEISSRSLASPSLLAHVLQDSVPETAPLMHDVSPLWSENNFSGSPSGLQPSSILSPPGISSPAAPNLAQILLPESVPDQTEPFMQDLNPSWEEYGLLGSPSRLQPWSIVSPLGISSEPFMQDLGSLWSEDNFTGRPSANPESPSSTPPSSEMMDPSG